VHENVGFGLAAENSCERERIIALTSTWSAWRIETVIRHELSGGMPSGLNRRARRR